MPPVVLHIIPAIGQGGAERLLSDIVARAGRRAEHRILTLTDMPAFFPYPGAAISSLGMRRGRVSPWALAQAARAVRAARPAVIHAWLYHGNLLASLLPRGGAPLIWSIHNTTLPPAVSGLTRAVNRAGALLSGRSPWRIVYCAPEARQLHEGLGYAHGPGLVLENGVDFSAFAFSVRARERQRAAWGLEDGILAIGCASRFDPQKDHAGLARAFALLDRPDARLVLAGAGCTADNPALMSALVDAGVAGRTLPLGPVDDMPAFHAAIDVLAIGSAFGEALPMVGLEAVAAGLPIAGTRLGAIPNLVLDPAHLARPGSADSLARALRAAAETYGPNRPAPAALARLERLRARYDIGAVADAYHTLYEECKTACKPFQIPGVNSVQ